MTATPSIVPFVTVIMPIRNEGGFIERSLGAVVSQTYPHDRYEVLLADGMSTDDTRLAIARLASSSDVDVKIVDNPGKIVPTGFNAALALARGAVIVRVDGHTIIAQDYVRACVETLERSGADNVGGKMNAVGRTFLARAIALATSSAFGVGGARFHYSDREELVDTVYMGAWPRSVFERIGVFDEELVRNQDDEFNYRLRAQGGKILLSPHIQSEYFNRSSWRSLARQYYQYGVYKVRVMQKHPRQMQPRQFIPPVFNLGVVGGLVVAPFSDLLRAIWLICLGIYLAGALLVSARIAMREGWQYLPVLPVLFLTLHLSYGAGFILGLWKFRGRWKA
ncbi:MAG: glycosyltransferase family 2 protein [Chloroflexi bacterium]|nr:glycosyltransferase family 2 protein [Chloroflexota bacterium]